MDLSSPGVTRETTREVVGSLYPWLPVSYLDESEFLKYMDRRVQLSRLPYRILKARYPDVAATPDPAWYAVLCDLLLLDFGKLAAGRDSAIAEISGSRILLALIAYRDRFGAYPGNLKTLRVKLGWEIPPDPFSGKDFGYRRQGRGFILYSIGDDLKDDGGRVVRTEKRSVDIPVSKAEWRRLKARVPGPTAPGPPATPAPPPASHPVADSGPAPGAPAPNMAPVPEMPSNPDVHEWRGRYTRTVHYKSEEYADIVWEVDR